MAVSELQRSIEQADIQRVTELLRDGADINVLFEYSFHGDSFPTKKVTPLILAAGLGYEQIVQLLLDRAADLKARTKDGRNALHMACCCGKEHVCRILLQRAEANGAELLRNMITAEDKEGHTPLHKAAMIKSVLMVFRLLETSVYFPPLPTQDPIARSKSPEKEAVANLLLETDLPSGDQHQRAAITYWAILNGQLELLERCMERGSVALHRGKACWTHVAAIGGHKAILKYLLENGYKDEYISPAHKDLTPLHLAVMHGHLDLIKGFLQWLQTESDRMQEAFLSKSTDGATPIALATSQSIPEHRKIEDALWEALKKSVADDESFFQKRVKWEPVVQQAARYEIPRNLHEDDSHLRYFLLNVHRQKHTTCSGGGSNTGEKWNALQLAVYHGCPIVVWFMLSRGGNRIADNIRKGLNIVRSWHGEIKNHKIIEEILLNPPPREMGGPTGPKNDNRQVPGFQHQGEQYGGTEGFIVDLFPLQGKGRIETTIKQRPIKEIIYKPGPQAIMTARKYPNLSALEQALKTSNEKAIGNQDGNGQLHHPTEPHVRWIYLPVNDSRCVRELMVRLSLDSGRDNSGHRPLNGFIDRTLTRGRNKGNKDHIKPQFVIDDMKVSTDRQGNNKAEGGSHKSKPNERSNNNEIKGGDSENQEPIRERKNDEGKRENNRNKEKEEDAIYLLDRLASQGDDAHVESLQ